MLAGIHDAITGQREVSVDIRICTEMFPNIYYIRDLPHYFIQKCPIYRIYKVYGRCAAQLHGAARVCLKLMKWAHNFIVYNGKSREIMQLSPYLVVLMMLYLVVMWPETAAIIHSNHA